MDWIIKEYHLNPEQVNALLNLFDKYNGFYVFYIKPGHSLNLDSEYVSFRELYLLGLLDMDIYKNNSSYGRVYMIPRIIKDILSSYKDR